MDTALRRKIRLTQKSVLRRLGYRHAYTLIIHVQFGNLSDVQHPNLKICIIALNVEILFMVHTRPDSFSNI